MRYAKVFSNTFKRQTYKKSAVLLKIFWGKALISKINFLNYIFNKNESNTRKQYEYNDEYIIK